MLLLDCGMLIWCLGQLVEWVGWVESWFGDFMVRGRVSVFCQDCLISQHIGLGRVLSFRVVLLHL